MNVQISLDTLNDLNQFLNDYRSGENFKELKERSKLIAATFDAKSVTFSRKSFR